MTTALEDHNGTISVGGRIISNLRFADDTDLLAGNAEELEDLTRSLHETSSAFGMEISAEKSKVIVTPGNRKDSGTNLNNISIGDTKLTQVHEFKYLGAHLTEDSTSTREVKTRLAIAKQQLAKMKKIWRCRSITLKVKLKLRAVVTSTALYGCESCTLTTSLEKKIHAFEMKCFRKLLGLPYTAHRTNESVKQQVIRLAGTYETLLGIIRRRKLQWFGHTSRHSGTLSHTILQGYIEGK